MSITLQGLSRNQISIANMLWTECQTIGDVQKVLNEHGQDAVIVYEMLTAEALDQYMETDLATLVIDLIKNKE